MPYTLFSLEPYQYRGHHDSDNRNRGEKCEKVEVSLDTGVGIQNASRDRAKECFRRVADKRNYGYRRTSQVFWCFRFLE